MAGLRLALILFLVAGGVMSLRWTRLIPAHIAVAVAVGAVFVIGADCPPTVWQKSFLAHAGRPVYDGGFVEHYLLRSFVDGGMTRVMKAFVVATWVVPSVASYLVRGQPSDRVTVISSPRHGGMVSSAADQVDAIKRTASPPVGAMTNHACAP